MTGTPVKPAQNQPRVLVLDDEEGVCRVVHRSLTIAGALATTVTNGRAGLQALMTGTFDALVVDIYMEEMDGVAFLQEALRIWPWLSVTIITGQPDHPLVGQARKLGATRVFAKPFDTKELSRHVLSEARTKRGRFDDTVARSLEQYTAACGSLRR